MRYRTIALFTASLVFVCVQLLSFCSALNTMVYHNQIDDDDLEDIVPMDPFLRSLPNRAESIDTYSLSSGPILSAAPILDVRSQPRHTYSRLSQSLPVAPAVSKLWLINCALLY